MATLIGVPGMRYTLLSGLTYVADIDTGEITATGRQIIELLEAGCDFAVAPALRAAEPEAEPERK